MRRVEGRAGEAGWRLGGRRRLELSALLALLLASGRAACSTSTSIATPSPRASPSRSLLVRQPHQGAEQDIQLAYRDDAATRGGRPALFSPPAPLRRLRERSIKLGARPPVDLPSCLVGQSDQGWTLSDRTANLNLPHLKPPLDGRAAMSSLSPLTSAPTPPRAAHSRLRSTTISSLTGGGPSHPPPPASTSSAPDHSPTVRLTCWAHKDGDKLPLVVLNPKSFPYAKDGDIVRIRQLDGPSLGSSSADRKSKKLMSGGMLFKYGEADIAKIDNARLKVRCAPAQRRSPPRTTFFG